MTSWRSPRAGEVGPIRRIVEQRVEDRPGAVERLARLEERHDVEDGRRRRRRRTPSRASSRTSVTSLADDVKLTTKRWQASTPKRAWIAAIARNVPSTSSSVTPAPPRSSRGRLGADRLERRPVDRRVLADLERREVEPERADLPAQVGDLAPGDALEAVGEERVLELGELGVELVGRRRIGRSAAPARRSARPASGAAARR